MCATPVDLPATFACRIAGPALHSSSNTIKDAARHTAGKRQHEETSARERESGSGSVSAREEDSPHPV